MNRCLYIGKSAYYGKMATLNAAIRTMRGKLVALGACSDLSAILPDMAKVAIVGSREYPHEESVREFVRSLPEDTVVISGGARGVDRWAEDEALRRGMQVLIFPANWKLHGKQAGMIRNREIVKACEKVIAFWDGSSRGTKSTIDMAKAAGVECVVYDE